MRVDRGWHWEWVQMIDWLMGLSGIIFSIRLLLATLFHFQAPPTHSRTCCGYKTLTLIDLTIFPLTPGRPPRHRHMSPPPAFLARPWRPVPTELVVLPTGKHQKSSSCVTSIGATNRRPLQPGWGVESGWLCLPLSYGECGHPTHPTKTGATRYEY